MTQGGGMQTPRRICSIHHVVELVPGVWTLHRVVRQTSRSHDHFTEAACPTCLRVAREALAQQFPAFYTAATPLTRPPAS
jgi:hypothetical protein